MRLIDSVGYMVSGAVGAEEDGQPRMVTTPWYDHEIPMTQAAELGTRKVMEDHCTIGVVVTTDGSITDIPRDDYLEPEARSVGDMKQTGKPFLVLLNSRYPDAAETQLLAQQLEQQYGVSVLPVNCLTMEQEDILEILQQLLYAFPVEQLNFYLPGVGGSLAGGSSDQAGAVSTAAVHGPAHRTSAGRQSGVCRATG